MYKRRSLKTNFLFALSGNMIYMACQYLILMLFTKSFTQDAVGSYLFAIAFVSPIVISADMQLRSFYVTEKADGPGFYQYQSFRIISNALAFLVVVIAAYLLQPALFITILLVGAVKIIENQVDMYYASVQRVERMDYISYSKIVRGIATLVMVFIGIKAGLPVNTILLLWLALWIVFLFFDARLSLKISNIGRRDAKFFELKPFVSIFKVCVSVLILLVVFQYYSNFPNYIVKAKLGLAPLAIFGSIIYFRSIGAQVINPMGAVIAPRLSDYWRTERYPDFINLLVRTTFLALGLGLAGILLVLPLGRQILQLVYTKEYADYNMLLVLVMAYCLPTYLYVFIGTALTCLRVHWIKLPIHIIAFMLLAGLTYWQYAEMTLYKMVVNMIIAESLTFILYTLSFIILYNKIRYNGFSPKGIFKNIS